MRCQSVGDLVDVPQLVCRVLSGLLDDLGGLLGIKARAALAGNDAGRGGGNDRVQVRDRAQVRGR